MVQPSLKFSAWKFPKSNHTVLRCRSKPCSSIDSCRSTHHLSMAKASRILATISTLSKLSFAHGIRFAVNKVRPLAGPQRARDYLIRLADSSSSATVEHGFRDIAPTDHLGNQNRTTVTPINEAREIIATAVCPRLPEAKNPHIEAAINTTCP